MSKIRTIDIDIPCFYGKSDDQIRSLVKFKYISDSSHHNGLRIKQGKYFNFRPIFIWIEFNFCNGWFIWENKCVWYELQITIWNKSLRK